MLLFYGKHQCLSILFLIFYVMVNNAFIPSSRIGNLVKNILGQFTEPMKQLNALLRQMICCISLDFCIYWNIVWGRKMLILNKVLQ